MKTIEQTLASAVWALYGQQLDILVEDTYLRELIKDIATETAKRYAQQCCEDLRERIIKELDWASPETIRNVEIILP